MIRVQDGGSDHIRDRRAHLWGFESLRFRCFTGPIWRFDRVAQLVERNVDIVEVRWFNPSRDHQNYGKDFQSLRGSST